MASYLHVTHICELGRGIFTTAPFEKGDFLLEYQGQLITHQECERRQRIYHDSLKDFMFKFRFDGKLWWWVLSNQN